MLEPSLPDGRNIFRRQRLRKIDAAHGCAAGLSRRSDFDHVPQRGTKSPRIELICGHLSLFGGLRQGLSLVCQPDGAGFIGAFQPFGHLQPGESSVQQPIPHIDEISCFGFSRTLGGALLIKFKGRHFFPFPLKISA